MNTDKVYHYVYRITNIVENKHYYGKRTSKVHPKSDLGIKYFSSSSNKTFIIDQKINPSRYKYKILKVHSTSKSALLHEIKLHKKFNVAVNPNFYNKAVQTSTGFNQAGVKASKELKEKLSRIHKERVSKPGFVGPNKGRKWSQETIQKMAECRKGLKAYQARPANVYEYGTNKLIAENVALKPWAKEHGYDYSTLHKVAKADFTQPNSSNNKHYHKGIYARYIETF